MQGGDEQSDAAAFAKTVLGGLEDTVNAGDAGADGAAPPSVAVVAKGTPERYRVQGTLGEGGMGRVLDATDLWFGRRVALKEILLDAAPPVLMKRFLVEALVTGNLEHPGIVAVHERGVRDGRPYYVMRKLHGKTLADALDAAKDLRARTKLVPSLIRVAQTIAFAHERGVIHRDLKPENVVLGNHGEVTVIDWGIARIRKLEHLGLDAEEAPQVANMAAQRQTVAGAVLGTPAYMAPEQAAGKLDAIDERTDVFALGALLYHVLSGHAPYSGATLAEQMKKALAVEMPSLVGLDEKVPAPLVAICEQAMAKDPDDRFRTATELAEALERAVTDAIAGEESRFVKVFAGAVSAIGVSMGGIFLAFILYRMVKTWADLGDGVWLTTLAGVLGLALALTDFVTKGRYHLGQLVLAFAGLAFAGGLLATTMGAFMTARAAQAPEVMNDALRYRALVTEGFKESIGNLVVGCALSAFTLLLWALASRRAARGQRQGLA